MLVNYGAIGNLITLENQILPLFLIIFWDLKATISFLMKRYNYGLSLYYVMKKGLHKIPLLFFDTWEANWVELSWTRGAYCSSVGS